LGSRSNEPVCVFFGGTCQTDWPARVPETLQDEAARLDAQERVLGGGVVEARQLGVGKERVRPPDASEHLVANTQLLAVVEAQPLVVPLLPEVEIHREVLRR